MKGLVSTIDIRPHSGHIYSDGKSFNFNAYYKYNETYPYGRIYFFKATMLEVSKVRQFLDQKNLKLKMVNDWEFEKIIDLKNHKKRIGDYKERASKTVAPVRQLHDGRKGATKIDKTYLLNSQSCLVCNSNNIRLMTASLCGDRGVMLGFYLCEACEKEASQAPSLIEYLVDKLNFPSPFTTKPLSQTDIFNLSTHCMQNELQCTIEVMKPDGDKIIGKRKSGFKIIFRLTSPDDYAYMVFDSNGKQVGRFDSAKHYPVHFGPDHLHYALPRTKSVKSSFTTGLPNIDVVALKKFIEDKENGDGNF
jgi:hypothetical protein